MGRGLRLKNNVVPHLLLTSPSATLKFLQMTASAKKRKQEIVTQIEKKSSTCAFC